MINLAIIGGGPAGLAAGLYATRGGVKNVVLFESGILGGQITGSSEIENYPGVATLMDGNSFMQPWIEQSMRFGLKQERTSIKRVSKNEDGAFTLLDESGKTYLAKAVIVCTGSKPRRAGFKGEDEFFGRGVSTCATCDGFFYKNKEIAVIGGGDTAVEEAIYLSHIVSKVYLIHRREGFRAAPTTLEKAKNNPKIEFVLNAKIDEVYGDKMGVTGVRVKFKDNSTREIDVPGVFTFVGLDVRNNVIKDENDKPICGITESGQIGVNLKMETSLKGLFAAGDIRADAPKQVVSAAGDGATAALSAMSYLESLE
ncbi:thioredoxin reductase [Campylobacter blaseri]|uniref:Thioredoxin reductase n=1 Tax=Campylobacter blaseri TaxID=2042961 RepID=A0A2P8R109_9BACT|nr:thioredoxin-disulfide reductase [Campylobacter blaseri]PSM52188.1 thioredoxin-disulfide reductase [Campylobacter blaseri]PSM53954.1 thioredoxin-disulfide reductase [Campylobacter blaseri]QKF85391.1 thioredoxin reductase [Campylobacter blaseri]